MRKKVILIYFMVIKIIFSATEWNFSGINGNGSITILYKTLPPLVVEVDEPELMRIKRGKDSFKYSDVSRSKKPLNVNIEIQFNNGIIDNNGSNKDIISTIYDTVKLELLNNGEITLLQDNLSGVPRNNDSLGIKGEVYFTNISGIELENKYILIKKLGESIKNGLLTTNDIYIDAEFNKEKNEILSGQYSGKIIMSVEFIGKGNI